MKKRHLYIIVFIISVIGMVVVQYQYLRIGLNLVNVKFNQNMGKAVKDIQTDLSVNNKLTFLLGKALTNDESYFKTNLDSLRASSDFFLNDFLEYKLLENGVRPTFSYKLYVKGTNLFLNSDDYVDNEVKSKRYPIQIVGYLPNLTGKMVILELQFNHVNDYFLFQLNGLTIPSLIFIIAIIVVVIWVLRSFYWQQRIITRTNDFINNLTHELKTPVFSIGLAVKMLEQNVNDHSKTFLEIIRNQNDRLKEHIDKVLQLASLENDNSLNLSKLDFLPHLKKLCTEFQSLSQMEAVDFKFEIIGDKYLLNCEPMHLSNAINNLLDNAKKYRLERPKITLKAVVVNKKLNILVTDNGIGIDKKDQKNVFKKHFRVSLGDLYHVKGYGLGLNYVKKIVNLHKGKIKLESKLDEGTHITIILPILN